jgi:excisionase family DNA binding protein
MKKQEYLTIPQVAKILGISRIAVYKKVRSGQIKAQRIGRIYAIPRKKILGNIERKLTEKTKRRINATVRKAM